MRCHSVNAMFHHKPNYIYNRVAKIIRITIDNCALSDIFCPEFGPLNNQTITAWKQKMTTVTFLSGNSTKIQRISTSPTHE